MIKLAIVIIVGGVIPLTIYLLTKSYFANQDLEENEHFENYKYHDN